MYLPENSAVGKKNTDQINILIFFFNEYSSYLKMWVDCLAQLTVVDV